jgi:predicted lactoylglutathione lyase
VTTVDLNIPPYRAIDPVIKPRELITGTFLTKDLGGAKRFYEDLLGLECAVLSDRRMLVRDPQHVTRDQRPKWVLDVYQSEDIQNPQRLLHHWGIDLNSKKAVDRMHKTLLVNKEAYGLRTIYEPKFQHGSYAFYFSDQDSNWWEYQYLPPSLLTNIFQRGDLQ